MSGQPAQRAVTRLGNCHTVVRDRIAAAAVFQRRHESHCEQQGLGRGPGFRHHDQAQARQIDRCGEPRHGFGIGVVQKPDIHFWRHGQGTQSLRTEAGPPHAEHGNGVTMSRKTCCCVTDRGEVFGLLRDGDRRKSVLDNIGTHCAPDVPRRRARRFQRRIGQAVIADHAGHAAADILGIDFWHSGSVSTPGPAVCVVRRAIGNAAYCGQIRRVGERLT